MNRVVLCGRLADRPRLSFTASGLTVAILRLQVPRQGLEGVPQAMDGIDCLAFEDLARRLHVYGEPGLQLNLEGWLLSAPLCVAEGQPALAYRVAVEAAYWLDPRAAAPQPDGPIPLPEAGAAMAAAETATGFEAKPTGFIRVREFLARVATRFTGTDRKPGLNGQAGTPCSSP